MTLKNKTILIISPQAWGEMFISKHHYALTLAKMGNRVYFLNPPQKNTQSSSNITISTSCTHRNLLLIEHTLKFPFLLKFHAIRLFHVLMASHVKKILKTIGQPLDIVWSFDQCNLYPLRLFDEKSFKIFQPVDEPQNNQAIEAAKDSQLILSVTNEILEKYKDFEQPRHLINHGIGEDFLIPATAAKPQKSVHIGLSGNLLRADIDRPVLLKIIDQHPQLVFECWGAYTAANNNIGGVENAEARSFIRSLQQKGVILHGPVNSVQLARELQRMDAFLICYDVKKDQSKGTNYHKIMEYLSTGKVVVANNVSAYQALPGLIQMVGSRHNNRTLPDLFHKVIQHLAFYNSIALKNKRIEYARKNSYLKQVDKIQTIIGDVLAVHNVPAYH